MIPSACIPIYSGDRTTLIKRENDFFVVVRTRNTKDGRWYQYRVYPTDLQYVGSTVMLYKDYANRFRKYK